MAKCRYVKASLYLSLTIVVLANFCFGSALQWYYKSLHCQMNEAYISENREIAVTLIALMKNISETHTREWWVDFGTLLALQRHSQPMVWDSDSDFSIIVKDQAEKAAIMRAINKFASELPVELQFSRIAMHPNKQLVQFFKKSKSHSDIFFWERHTYNTKKMLTNHHDRNTPAEANRSESEVFPVQVRLQVVSV